MKPRNYYSKFKNRKGEEFVTFCVGLNRYGGCFKTRIFGETHVFVSSNESAKLILNDGGGRFTKKYIKSIAELVGHQSLLCASHLHHKFLRSRLINLFSSCFLASFVMQFDQQIVSTFQCWNTGSTIVLLNEALKVNSLNFCLTFN